MGERQRLFFALWPPPALAAELARVAADAARVCAGRCMSADSLHLTLAFLGDVAIERLPELSGVANGLDCAPLRLTLDRLGGWRHNALVWAGASAPPPELSRLTICLADGLRRAGFSLPQRDWQPHVTLLRKANLPAALPQLGKLEWEVQEFVLVASRRDAAGARYTCLDRWALRGAR